MCKNEVNYSLHLKYSSYPNETITYYIVNLSFFFNNNVPSSQSLFNITITWEKKYEINTFFTYFLSGTEMVFKHWSQDTFFFDLHLLYAYKSITEYCMGQYSLDNKYGFIPWEYLYLDES